MKAKFLGGPYDGKEFDHHQINSVAMILPVATHSGHRQFLLMPPVSEAERVIRGEIPKDEARGDRHPYERRFTGAGGVEYHDASTSGAMDEALAEATRPLSSEEQDRKRLFAEQADQFVQQLRAARPTLNTEVYLVYHYVGKDGRPRATRRTSIAPTTTVEWPGHEEDARAFAIAAHLDTLIGNIYSLVRGAPVGYLDQPGGSDAAVRIGGFELDIVHPVEVFRGLSISGDPTKLAFAVKAIEDSLTDGWSRNRKLETGHTQGYLCFACSKHDGRPSASLFLTEKRPGLLYAANIVPEEKRQLSRSEYNRILEEFYTRFVLPCVAHFDVTAELTESKATLENWLSVEAADKLRRFSHSANKSTGSVHPSDRLLWFAFVIAAHRERSTLDGNFLKRWLIEVERWAPEVADVLAGEYEFSRELLAFADRDTGM